MYVLDLAAPARAVRGAGGDRGGAGVRCGRTAVLRGLPVAWIHCCRSTAAQRAEPVFPSTRPIRWAHARTGRRQLRQLRLQPGAVPGPTGRRVHGAAQRRARTRHDPRALGGFGGVLVSPGPSTPERAGHSIDVIRACADRRLPGARRVPGPPGHRRGVGRRRGAGAGAAARQDQPGAPQRRRRAGRAARPVHRHPVPLADRAAGDRAGRVRGHRPDRHRHRDGDAASGTARRGRAVPP